MSFWDNIGFGAAADWVDHNFLGGAQEDAAKAQADALTEAQRLSSEGANQARGDILHYTPQAINALRGGYQGSIDTIGQATPQQIQALMSGNNNAQNQIMGSLEQMNSALLGGPIDYQAMMPQQQAMPDLSFLNQSLPGSSFSQQQMPIQHTVNPKDRGSVMAALQGLGVR